MNYRITTSGYFNVTAKRLAKKYPSFKDDLTNFGKSPSRTRYKVQNWLLASVR